MHDKLLYFLANVPNGIDKLEGGGYSIDTILGAISKFTTWALRIGITLSGVALIIGFIYMLFLMLIRRQELNKE